MFYRALKKLHSVCLYPFKFPIENWTQKQEVTQAMTEHSKSEGGRLIDRLSAPQQPLIGGEIHML